MTEQTLKTRALRGSFWTIGGFGASRVVRLVSHLLLAWLLTPEIFGLMALVKVFMYGLGMFSDIGIGPSIIQSKRGSDLSFLNTAWTIQVIRGFVLWLITCLLAGPFAWWYAQSDPAAWQLAAVLPVAAFSAVIHGFNSTALFTLNKELRLGWVTMIELGTQVVSIAVIVVWALLSPTVWAMVAGSLAGALTKMVVSHLLVPGHRSRLRWDKQCSKELFKFGKWIFLSTVFTFLAVNIDKLVLGKLLTLAELGLYSIAFVFAKAALDVTSRLGSSVMFPIYSKLQDEPARLMDVALKAREAVLWAGAGVCICFAVASPLFFETLWDPRYHGAGVLAQWLALLMWMRILLQSMDRIPLALGNSRALFFSNIIQTSGIILAIAGYWLFDMTGFIVGLAAGPLTAHLFLLSYLPTKQSEMLRQSIRFSGICGISGILLILGTSWLRIVSPLTWTIAVVISAVLPLSMSVWMLYTHSGIGKSRKSLADAKTQGVGGQPL